MLFGIFKEAKGPHNTWLILFGIFKEAKGPIILGPLRVSVVLRRLASVRILPFRPLFAGPPDPTSWPSLLRFLLHAQLGLQPTDHLASMARTGLGSVAELQAQPTTMRHGETYLTSRAEK